MSNKRLIPNIVRGGIAIPIPNKDNLYLVKGRKHKDGGVDIGSNLEVEDGEVLQMTPKNIKVFSALRILGGKSPAEKVLNGDRPDKVFKQQENFKDRNKINDDGTKKAQIGKKASVQTEKDKNLPNINKAYYVSINPLSGYPNAINALGHAYNVSRNLVPKDSTEYVVTDNVTDATWRKRLGLSYNENDLPSNADGSVRLPKDREMQIPTDTTLLKNRINANQKLSKRYKDGSYKKQVVDWAIGEDQAALDALRKTYKTGKPVVVNEKVYNSRSLIQNGNISMPGSSPLNMLQNYTIRYDKDKNVMEYKDVYDFNGFEPFVPGKPFNIKGEIDLNKKRIGGKMNNRFVFTANGKTKVGYVPSTGESRSEAEGNVIKAKVGINYKPNMTITPDKSFLTKPIIAIKDKSQLNKKPSKINNYIPDIIGLSGNIIGNVISESINNKMLNDLKYNTQPIARRAIKGITKINTSAEEDAMRESLAAYNIQILANTASSRNVLSRMQKARLDNLNRYNQLQERKTNLETQLINQDRQNRQNVINTSIADMNQYLTNKMNFENKVREMRSENTVNLINNVNKGLQDTLSRIEKRNAYNLDRAAIMAANPNVNPRILKMLGRKDITDEDIRRWEEVYGKSK